jgi:hypothetical protein
MSVWFAADLVRPAVKTFMGAKPTSRPCNTSAANSEFASSAGQAATAQHDKPLTANADNLAPFNAPASQGDNHETAEQAATPSKRAQRNGSSLRHVVSSEPVKRDNSQVEVDAAEVSKSHYHLLVAQLLDMSRWLLHADCTSAVSRCQRSSHIAV